jgi:O-antigen/teichoic acid export membrane protein
MAESWKDRFWHNLTCSYLATAVRLGTGLFVFPILYRHLSQEQFGFWSLLWGIVTYTVLMDFGIGSTARVEVARRAGRDDWKDLNGLLSTMFWSYALMFAAVESVVLSMRPTVLHWIHADGNPEFAHAYVLFTAMIAASVPLGMVMEVLRGLQRFDLVNVWWSVGQILNLVLILSAVHFKWSFSHLVLGSVIAAIVPMAGGWISLRLLVPEISLNPLHYRLSRLRPVISFSAVAYLLSVAGLVIARTDQVVISVCLGVSMVAVYQAGFKVGDLYHFGMTQLGDQLSTAAAQSDGLGRRRDLGPLLAQSTRLTALFATPLFVLAMLYLDPLIHFLTGLAPVPWIHYDVGVVLLVAQFSQLLTHSCACPMFLGGGWERKLLKLKLTEAALNLGLSIVLAIKIGVLGVAIGTMLPVVAIGWLWVVPVTLRFTGMTLWQWVRTVYAPIALPVIASLCVAIAGWHNLPGVTRAFPHRRVVTMVVTSDRAEKPRKSVPFSHDRYHFWHLIAVGCLTMMPLVPALGRSTTGALWEEEAEDNPLPKAA